MLLKGARSAVTKLRAKLYICAVFCELLWFLIKKAMIAILISLLLYEICLENFKVIQRIPSF